MKVSREALKQAVDENIINEPQAQALYQFLLKRSDQNPSLNFTNVLYYLGGMIAIGAMTLFMQLGWETLGGFGIFALCIVYAILGLFLTSTFHKKGLPIPAGICATFVVCLTPLAIYGFQVGMGWWAEPGVYREYHTLISWRWIFMEVGTLIVGLILGFIYRYPFMLMPIAVTLWYISMDLTSMLTGGAFDFQLAADVSMYFGLIMMLIALFVDLRTRNTLDYAFWLYLFGVMTFWGGLTSQHSDNELSRLIYCLMNLGLMGIGVLLLRRVFLVFGAFGVTIYLAHLADVLFKNSVLFPIVLTAIGLFIVYLGVLWQKNEATITQKLRRHLPNEFRELLEARENNEH